MTFTPPNETPMNNLFHVLDPVNPEQLTGLVQATPHPSSKIQGFPFSGTI